MTFTNELEREYDDAVDTLQEIERIKKAYSHIVPTTANGESLTMDEVKELRETVAEAIGEAYHRIASRASSTRDSNGTVLNHQERREHSTY